MELLHELRAYKSDTQDSVNAAVTRSSSLFRGSGGPKSLLLLRGALAVHGLYNVVLNTVRSSVGAYFQDSSSPN